MLKRTLASVALLTLFVLPVLAQKWTKLTPANSPPQTLMAALAYDADHSQAVMFGGMNPGAYTSTTWLWNGSTWMSSAGSSPSNRIFHGMATAPGGVLLFGGALGPQYGDTWLWNGTAWTAITPVNSPPARYGHAMAYDSQRNRVVLFGGTVVNDASFFSDTWEWDGTNWTQVASSGPSARAYATLAYDAVRGQMVLFGGRNGATFLDDTWVWDGAAWTPKTVSTKPQARANTVMAFHAAAGYVVLFGGQAPYSYGTYPLGDTWTWDGSAWTLRTANTAPQARGYAGMAYDAARAQVVLFGGMSGYYYSPNDTWVYTPEPEYVALVQQPIDPGGTSVFSARRGVVPVKFTLTANGLTTCTLPPATIAVSRTEGGTIGPVDESVYLQAADSGSNFRIDQPNCQYVYNLATSALGVGVYQVRILIGNEVVGTARFALN